jgi:hypothetical protein
MRPWLVILATLAMCAPAQAMQHRPCTAAEAGPMSTCVVLTARHAEAQWFSGRSVRTGFFYEAIAPWGRLNLHPVKDREWISRYSGHGLSIDLCACAEHRPSRIRVRVQATRPTPVILRYATA